MSEKPTASGARSRKAKDDEADAPQAPQDQTAAQQAAEEKEAAEVFAAAEKRGTYSPAQHDDDGWGGLPVQMRGGAEADGKDSSQS